MEVRESLSVPEGAYITEITMDSPAMSAGIQSGDIIVRIGATEIKSFAAYTAAMNNQHPGSAIIIELMRQGQEGYREEQVIVNLGTYE